MFVLYNSCISWKSIDGTYLRPPSPCQLGPPSPTLPCFPSSPPSFPPSLFSLPPFLLPFFHWRLLGRSESVDPFVHDYFVKGQWKCEWELPRRLITVQYLLLRPRASLTNQVGSYSISLLVLSSSTPKVQVWMRDCGVKRTGWPEWSRGPPQRVLREPGVRPLRDGPGLLCHPCPRLRPVDPWTRDTPRKRQRGVTGVTIASGSVCFP